MEKERREREEEERRGREQEERKKEEMKKVCVILTFHYQLSNLSLSLLLISQLLSVYHTHIYIHTPFSRNPSPLPQAPKDPQLHAALASLHLQDPLLTDTVTTLHAAGITLSMIQAGHVTNDLSKLSLAPGARVTVLSLCPLTVKLVHNDVIRKLALSMDETFDSLNAKLEGIYGGRVSMTFVDEEKDTVNLCSTEDVKHVIRLAQQQEGGTFRLKVSDVPPISLQPQGGKGVCVWRIRVKSGCSVPLWKCEIFFLSEFLLCIIFV